MVRSYHLKKVVLVSSLQRTHFQNLGTSGFVPIAHHDVCIKKVFKKYRILITLISLLQAWTYLFYVVNTCILGNL